MNQTEQAARVPELDGVRGLAVLLVVTYHLVTYAGTLTSDAFPRSLVQLVSLGWIGVDIFFVLSGFLITSILLKTRSKPHYFKNFYVRRILRIFPLYYLFIAVVFIFLPILSQKADLVNARAGWPFFMAYLHNWLFIPKFADRFSVAIPSYLGPTWSLAIEEQFYFLWPSVVYFLNRRKLSILSIAIVVLSLLIRVTLVQFASSWKSLEYFLYYSTFTRFDGLCVGALIALVFESDRGKQVISRFAWPVFIGAIAGMAGIVAANNHVQAFSTNPYLDMWGYSFLALGSGAMVVLATTSPSQGIVRSIFRNPGLRFFGKYSYSMYIIHVPIALLLILGMKAANYRSDISWLVFLCLSYPLTILGSLLTWNLLEKHAIALKKYFEYQPAKQGDGQDENRNRPLPE